MNYWATKMKKQDLVYANRAVLLSQRLGKAITEACDERLAEHSMPLGDFEIAIEEGSISPLKVLGGGRKVVGNRVSG